MRVRALLGFAGGQLAVLFFLLVFTCASSYAAGYNLYEWSARGNALGGTLVARADDPSAVIYNPAGITQLPGTQVTMGLTLVKPSLTVDFKDNTTYEDGLSEDKIWGIPNSYMTHQLSDKMWLGLGVYSRTGLGSIFENRSDYAGKFNSSKASIQSSSFTPNLAYKVTDKLSLAAGLEVIHMAVDLDKYPVPGMDTFEGKITSDGYDYGYNFAIHYKACDWMSLGATYRSQIDVTVDGDIDFTNHPMGLKTSEMEATEPVPAQFAVGIMVKPTKKLSIEFDATHTKWNAYETLLINYDSPFVPTTEIEKNWKNTWKFQFGAEYAYNEWLDLRAGYIYDNTPVPDETVDFSIPGSDRQIFSIGAGMDWNKWTFDVSYGYLIVKERHIDARGADVPEADFEDGDAHLLGFNATYRF